jgi:hypothetical protein
MAGRVLMAETWRQKNGDGLIGNWRLGNGHCSRRQGARKEFEQEQTKKTEKEELCRKYEDDGLG